tara:strand:- start:89 stop:784 length:696 start_codon:yes stop_codon:yes gene_type:complete
MEGGAPTNAGPINTAVTGKGAIMGFDPILKLHKRAVKKRKKMESAGKQWEHRKKDPTYIDGRSKQARKLIKRLTKKKKMAEETVLENSSQSGGENTKQAYKFISQKRKVQKKQEREKRAANRKQEIQMISRAKSSDYQKKAKDRQKKLSTQLQTKKESFVDGLVYLESLCELADEGKLTTFFFGESEELELNQEQAIMIINKFNQLSEEHQEKLVEMLPESKEVIETFLTL